MKLIVARTAGIILALAVAMGLAACSAIKLGYSTLPDLAYWWLDGYVDFNEAQEPLARQQLAQLHAWHRQQELPKLGELLARLEQMTPGSISAAQACTVVADVQARMDVVATRAEPAIVGLASLLTPKQLRHLERKYRSNNDAYRKDWIAVSADERKDKRYDQMLERIETIYGSLDAPQRAVLRQGIAQSMFDPQRVLAERQRRQQDLLQTLRRMMEPSTGTEAARTLLHAHLERVMHSPDLAYRAWQDALVQEGCRIFSAVHESTTAAQRQQAVRRLRAYQRDLRELSGTH
ncbi:DUF6279 family lipoprotein [Ramlibacter sp. XY19]|uniref:DUF6279 family lipoprotein n=1 Tax=Ramlibacter paludis TaxID=2908000 RepID=UPI0023DCD2EE|nr:DUF6279 family lipoprotein [Ramlibacter paludis]MCG2591354.1 DUF6279 family lipoprotein [Ramlibacter paludis]